MSDRLDRADRTERSARLPEIVDVVLVAPPLEYSAPALYAATLAQGLAGRGLRVRVIAPGGRLEAAFRERGVPVDPQPFLDRFIVDWFQMRRLVASLRDAGVKVVHAVSSLKVATASKLARKVGAPVVATVHRRLDPMGGPSVDWSATRAIITFSQDLREDCVNRRRAPKELVRVIPAGISAPPEVRRPFERLGAVPIVGTLGDVEKTAAQADFIAAGARVLERVSNLELLVVSGGAEPRSLRALSRDLGVASRVTFTTYTDTQKALSLMDVCVLPGADEGPGQTIIEAMAAGRPVITTGEGGAYDVLEDERSGLIVEKGDPQKLAAAILRLVEDRELARALGARAREVALARFPLDRMLDETLAAYAAAGVRL